MQTFATAMDSYFALIAVVPGTDNLVVISMILIIKFVGSNLAFILLMRKYLTHTYLTDMVEYSNKVLPLFKKAFLSWQ